MFNKEKVITYTIESKTIPMPQDDECVVFQFPKNTPPEVVDHFDKLLVEFQNQQRNFITTTTEIKMIKTKKGKLELYHETENDTSK